MHRFVFTHIMRTGGNSLRHYLYRAEERTFTDTTFRRDREGGIVYLTEKTHNYVQPQFDPTFHRGVVGHFRFNKYKHLGWKNIVMLREPVARSISTWQAWANNHSHPIYDNPVELTKRLPNHMTYITMGNLGAYDFVGILEEFDASLRVLEKILDVKFVDMPPKRNNYTKKEVSARDRRRIADANKLDQSLYEEGLRIFDEEIRRYL